MNSNSNKTYPHGSIDVHKMFGLSLNDGGNTEAVHPLDPHLPVEEKAKTKSNGNSNGASLTKYTEPKKGNLEAVEDKKYSPAVKVLVAVTPYIAVFVVGLLLYFFFFTKINFGTIFKLKPKMATLTSKDSVAESYKQQHLDAYKQWIFGYYFEVSDDKIIDPDTDNSGNGLTNFQKYLLGLNPKSYDTLGLGVSDSEALGQGINPQTGSHLSEEQKKTIEKYIDMEVVMNRFALANSRNQNRVAGVEVSQSNSQSGFKKPITPRANMNGVLYSENAEQVFPILDNSNSANQRIGESVNRSTQGAQNLIKPIAPITGPAEHSAGERVLDNPYGLEIDTNIPARLEIPELNVSAPIIWTKTPNSFLKDLQSGVVHYPGTALPGEVGTTYISGHSSNYVWAKGDYNKIFSKLGDLPDNTSFKITVVQKNGSDAILHYVVVRKKEYSPRDAEQFKNTDKSLVALSTCWPVGTTQRRLVVFGELTQVEK